MTAHNQSNHTCEERWNYSKTGNFNRQKGMTENLLKLQEGHRFAASNNYLHGSARTNKPDSLTNIFTSMKMSISKKKNIHNALVKYCKENLNVCGRWK